MEDVLAVIPAQAGTREPKGSAGLAEIPDCAGMTACGRHFFGLKSSEQLLMQ